MTTLGWLEAASLHSGRPVCSVNERDFPDVSNTYRQADF